MIGSIITLALAGFLFDDQGVGCVPYDELHASYPAASEVTAYIADISARDLQNSSGEALTSFRDVLRQDRANVHQFGAVDAWDRVDPFFATPEHRELFETMTVVSWCYEPLEQIAERIRTGSVAGFVEVTVFKSSRHPGGYFIHIGTVG